MDKQIKTYNVYVKGKLMDSFLNDYDSAIDYSIELSKLHSEDEIEIRRVTHTDVRIDNNEW